MLLPANTRLGDERVLARLRERGPLYVQPGDFDAWRRGLARAVGSVVHRNGKLSQLASADAAMEWAEVPKLPGEEWECLVMTLHKAMLAPAADGRWLKHAQEVRAHLRHLTAQRMDEALFHLLYTGGCRTAFYSSRQALRCMLIAGEAARQLAWDEARLERLDLAALTMNVASWALQDRLVRHVGKIDDPQDRKQIAHHPAAGTQLLQDCGVMDRDWLEAVTLHHDDSLAHRELAELSPGQQMALLLRRADCYSAMLSRRAGREPLSAMQAAQQTCLDTAGRPDPVGSLVLKALGLYPPGTFVSLASGECGIVLARGEDVSHPAVAALLNAQGIGMMEPRLRYTSKPDLGVRSALRPDQVAVEPPLEKLQGLWNSLRW